MPDLVLSFLKIRSADSDRAHAERLSHRSISRTPVLRDNTFGKAPAGVAAAARAQGIPCIAIAGGIGDGLGDLHAIGIDAVYSLCPGPISLAVAMAEGAWYLSQATEQATRGFLAGRGAGR